MQLNADKTYGSSLGGVDQATTSAAIGAAVMIVDGQMVAPVRSVIGTNWASSSILTSLCGRTYIAQVVSRCFVMLRQLRQVRRSLPATRIQTWSLRLIVLNRLDYANSTLQGWFFDVSGSHCPQSVLNASARLIYGLILVLYAHITDALTSLH